MADTDPGVAKIKEAEALLKSLKKLSTETGKTIEGSFNKAGAGAEYFGDKLEEVEESISGMSKSLKTLHIDKKLPLGKVLKLAGSLQKVQNKIDGIKNAHGPFLAEDLEFQSKKLKELTKEAGDLKIAISGSSKSFTMQAKSISGGAGQFKNLFNAFKGGSVGNMMQTAESAGEAATNMKAMGGAAKYMGNALGGVSKLLGGPAGIAITAGKALFDMTVQADTFVKNANKAFASVRGPDIMTGDVEGQFKKFNDQIYNASENIKDGLNADAIKGFMEALAQSGYNITQLQGGLTTYRTAVDVAAKASRTLGVDVVQVGQFMGTLMNDFRDDLEGVDKTFVQVAFDAKRSGVSTTNFWNTVQNATASLTLYGVKIDAAGKLFKTFTQNQIGGVKDAENATQDLMGMFKTTDRANAAFMMQMAKRGKFDVEGAFKGKAKAAGERATKIKEEIKLVEAKPATEENKNALDKLYTEMANAEKDQIRFAKDASESDLERATDFGSLAEDAANFVPALLKGLIPGITNLAKVSDKQLMILEQTHTITNVQAATLRTMVQNAQHTQMQLKDLSNYMGNFGDTLISSSDDLKNGFAESLAKMEDSNENTQQQGYNELYDALSKSGMGEHQARELSNLSKSNKNIRETLKSTLKLDKKSFKQDLSNLQRLLNSDDLGNQAAFQNIDDRKLSDKELAKKDEDTFKKITSLTLSTQEQVDIMGDEAKYRLYSTSLFKGMNKGIGFIAKFLTKTLGKKMDVKDEYLTPEEEEKVQKDAADRMADKVGNSLGVEKWSDTVETISKKLEKPGEAKISPNLIKAVISTESAGNAFAVPKDPKTGKLLSSAKGLMQLVKGTAKDMEDEPAVQDIMKSTGKKGPADLFDPTTNIAMGSRYLQKLLTKYKGDTRKAVASYYAGPGAIDDAVAKGGNWEENINDATKDYLKKVTSRMASEIFGTGVKDITEKADIVEKPEANLSIPMTPTPTGTTSAITPVTPPKPFIFPLSGTAKTSPLMGPPAPTAAGSGGAAGATFNINISADTKDLAKQIGQEAKNKVREVLYKNQLNGQG
jgi:hypothetical protein